MKKLLAIIVLGLLWSGNAFTQIIELNKCFNNKYLDYKKKKWNQKAYESFNHLYIKAFDKSSKEYKSGLFHEYLKNWYYDFESKDLTNFKKVDKFENISLTISQNSITKLEIYTDDYVKHQNDVRKKQIPFLRNLIANKITAIDKYNFLYTDPKRMLEEVLEPFGNKKVTKFALGDYYSDLIYGLLPGQNKNHEYVLKQGVMPRFGIEINLKELTFREDQLKYLKEGKFTDSRPGIYICQGEDDKDREASGSSGTAFFINSKGFLLTNNHVVEGCKLQQVKYNDKDYTAEIIATDNTLDLALMKVDVRPREHLNFTNSSVEKLQKVYVAGYPFGQGLSDDLKISSGIISSIKGYNDNSNEFQLDAAINPGNSGGPIVNDAGELVGIAVAGFAKDESEGINFGIKSSSAKEFLKINKISQDNSFMSFGMNNKKLINLLENSTVYTYCN